MSNTSQNQFTCAGVNCGNTGMPNCTFKPGFIGAAILVPKGKIYTTSQLAAFQTVLMADLVADNPQLRIIPVKEFTTVEGASSEAVYEEVGTSSYFVRDGKLGMNTRIDASICLWSKLRNYNDKQDAFDLLLVDTTNNIIWGTKVATGLKGFALDKLAVPQFNPATTSTVFNFAFNFMMKNIAEFENFGFVQFDQSTDVLGFLNGLIDFNIEVATALNAGGLVTVKAKSGCSNQDLAPTYLSNLAQVTAWNAKVDADGTAITIASVAQNATLNGWDIQLTLPNTTILPVGATFTLNSGLPSVLSAAPINMPGFIGCPITLTRV